jgi:4-amino-4-deoxy-L-arabinose transferase-like glycosyltransferase
MNEKINNLLAWLVRQADGPRYLLAALVMAGAIYLPFQGHGLWRTTDAREAEIAREMLENQNLAVPHFNGEVFLEKPPLFSICTALSYKIFGVSARAARVPSMIFAIASLLALAVIGKKLKGGAFGVALALVAGTTVLYLKRGHEAYLDIALTAFATWSLAAFLAAYRPFTREQKTGPLVAFYVLLTAAFFIKGLVGPLVPLLTAAVYILWLRDFRAILRLKPWLGILIFVALTAPWHYELWKQGGMEYFKIFYINNHLYRFVPSDEVDLGHHTEWWWYFWTTWKFFRPWSLLFPVAFITPLRREFKAWLGPDSVKFMVSWLVPSFLFFTISSTKREDYLLPIYGAFAAFVAAWMLFRFETDKEPKWERYYELIFAALVAAAAVYVPAVSFKEYSGPLMLFVMVSILSVVGVAAVAFRIINDRPHRVFDAVMVAAWLAAIAGAVLLLPVEEKERDHSAFCEKAAELTAKEPAIYCMGPSETERAFLGFYLKRRVTNLELPPRPELLPGPGQRIAVAVVARTDKQIAERKHALLAAGMEVEQALYDKVSAHRGCVLWWVKKKQERLPEQ